MLTLRVDRLCEVAVGAGRLVGLFCVVCIAFLSSGNGFVYNSKKTPYVEVRPIFVCDLLSASESLDFHLESFDSFEFQFRSSIMKPSLRKV